MIKPYYEEDGIVLYLGDCLEILPELPKVDLVTADPPFNVGKRYAKGADRRNDYEDWCKEWVSLSFDILDSAGSFYLMTITRHLPFLFPLMNERGVFINQVAWVHAAGTVNKRAFHYSYQPILLYGKTGDYFFETYAEKKINPNRLRWGGYTSEPKGQLKDIWDDIPFVWAGAAVHPEAVIEEGTNRKAHPCQAPLNLLRRQILFSSQLGQVVLDPHCGSGTALLAAKSCGRKAIGIEVEEQWCELAVERLRQGELAL